MIPEKVREALKLNWGEKADSLNCYAEVKFIDTLTPWACYIFALNPQDEDEIACIVHGGYRHSDIYNWSMKDLILTYNRNGEYPVIDTEYRRMKASELFKKLNEGK